MLLPTCKILSSKFKSLVCINVINNRILRVIFLFHFIPFLKERSSYPFFFFLEKIRKQFYIIVQFIIWNIFLCIDWVYYDVINDFVIPNGIQIFRILTNFATCNPAKRDRGNWTSRCVSISAIDCIYFVIVSWQVIENRRKLRQAISGPLVSYRGIHSIFSRPFTVSNK